MFIQENAERFLSAFEILKESNDEFISNFNNSIKNPTTNKVFASKPTMGVEIVCLAFSLELYIKNLHYVINGKVPRGHKILKLFEELPKEIQQKIFAHDAISQNPFNIRGNIFSPKLFSRSYTAYDRFIDQVKAISGGFEKWRYSHESSTLRYDVSFALALIEAIKSISNSEVKFSLHP